MKILSISSFILLFVIISILLFLSNSANTSLSGQYQPAYDDIISQKDIVSRALSRSYYLLEKVSADDKDIFFDARSLITHARSSQHIDLGILQNVFSIEDGDVLKDLAESLVAYQKSADTLTARLEELLANETLNNTASLETELVPTLSEFVNKASLHDIALMHAEASFSQKIKSGLGKTNQLIFYIVLVFTAVLLSAILFFSLYEMDRKRAQRRLEFSASKLSESEEKLRAIFEASPNPVVVHDREGGTQYLNPAFTEIFKWTLTELKGKPIPYIPDNQESITKTKIKEAYTSGLPVRFTTQRKTKSGEIIEVIASVAKIEAINGNDVGMVVNLTDITQQKHLEAQLLHSQKLESVGRLAGGVAHDFNNMLSVILGHTELAMQKTDESDPLRPNLKLIHEASRRSEKLTKQLLAFARRQSAQPIVMNLNPKISGMLKMLGRLIGEDIRLIWNPGKNLMPIKMDPIQIDQILVNLCVNAQDAITGNGSVVISTEMREFQQNESYQNMVIRSGSYTVLKVSDNGCGMDKDTVDKIFEPFFTTKSLGKGTGLGLATVYGIVKQNNGYIFVESTLETGTIFTLFLPASNELPEFAEAVENETVVGGKESILIVEDEEAILELSKTALEESGYQVHAVKNPEEAIAFARQKNNEFDLLISDVVMPNMNGKELRQHIKEIYNEIKVLFISGYTADIIHKRGIVQDDVNFLQKPFSINQLMAKVRNVLDQDATT